jgi:hypothetical protein
VTIGRAANAGDANSPIAADKINVFMAVLSHKRFAAMLHPLS